MTRHGWRLIWKGAIIFFLGGVFSGRAELKEDISAVRQQWPFIAVAEVTPPRVKGAEGITAIDRFIKAKLEEKGLVPAKLADKRTLIRRATFDLTGLPPTPEEVRAFLEDESPGAFGRVVERLLSSPSYGERWGRHWLDVVRYTDSFDARGIGGEADVPEAYRYRDWVVKAFNDDLPYDQFVIQQIAGDLLPAAEPGGFNTNAVIATGVYVIGEWGVGDADKEKMLTDIVDDQIDLTGRAFLGLTLACARCHDHKFDPISAEDYYGLAGIFFSSHILPNPGLKTAGSATLRIPLAPPGEVARKKDLDKRIADLGKQMEKATDGTISAFATNSLAATASNLERLWEWKQSEALLPLTEAGLLAWRDLLGWNDMVLLSKLKRDIAGKKGVDAWAVASGADTPSATINSTMEDVSITTLTLPAKSVSVHPSPKAGVAVAWKAPAKLKIDLTGSIADSDEKCGDGIEWSLRLVSRHLRRELVKGRIENGKEAELPSQNGIEVSAGDTVELVIGPKGGHACDTTTITLRLESEQKSWDLAGDVLAAERTNPAGSWSFHDAAAPGVSAEMVKGSDLEKWLQAPNETEKKAAAQSLQETFVTLASVNDTNQPDYKIYKAFMDPKSAAWTTVRGDLRLISEELVTELKELRANQDGLRAQLPPPFPVAHGLQEGGTPDSAHAGFNDARVHLRGRYDRLGDPVPRAFPAVLSRERPEIKAATSGRMELAEWIASKENPLTARVMANRVWQHHFGEGIVRTPNNFGKLGTAPTHAELLDYLAAYFVDSGWSVKALHRLIMNSAAYQQSTVPEARMLEADPDNLLFGRMNRKRLEAEAIRDSLLSAAGNLELKQGGKAIRELDTNRRTLYVMTIRSDRATYQSLFDAADPGGIVEKRIDSTVAPQALFLLNHPFAVKQAEALGRRLETISSDPRERIVWLYELLYARPAAAHEVELGIAATGATNGDWTGYCQVLLAANEFVYVD